MTPSQDSLSVPIILTLQGELTVLPNQPTGLDGDVFGRARSGVAEVQIVVLKGDFDADALAGSMVEVTGELYPGTTGHHYRPVLIGCDAQDVRLLAPFRLLTIPGARVLATGSGIVINERGYILTAHHVASGHALSVRRELARHEAELIAIHPTLDIAVLKSDILCEQGVPLRQWPSPMLGERVYAAGYPLRGYLGHGVSFTEGIISNDRINAAGCFHFTAPVQPGNSGGPIFDALGHLLGIVVAQAFPDGRANPRDVRQIQLLNEGVHVGMLARFLDKHNVPHEFTPFVHRVDQSLNPTIVVPDIARRVCVEVESWMAVEPPLQEEIADHQDLATW